MIADDRFLFKVVAECLIDTGARSTAGPAGYREQPAASSCRNSRT
jgi:hypothetical protein